MITVQVALKSFEVVCDLTPTKKETEKKILHLLHLQKRWEITPAQKADQH